MCIYCIYLFICLIKLVKFKLLGCFSLYLCCLVMLAHNNINNPGHLNKMATIPIYSKNLRYLLLRNQLTSCNETWDAPVALMTKVLQFVNK